MKKYLTELIEWTEVNKKDKPELPEKMPIWEFAIEKLRDHRQKYEDYDADVAEASEPPGITAPEWIRLYSEGGYSSVTVRDFSQEQVTEWLRENFEISQYVTMIFTDWYSGHLVLKIWFMDDKDMNWAALRWSHLLLEHRDVECPETS